MDRNVTPLGIFLVLAILHILTVRGQVCPAQRNPGFFVISNLPEIGIHKDLYIYAINSDAPGEPGEVEIIKDGGLYSEIVKTGVIKDGDCFFGCYFQVKEPNRQKGLRYGRYEATYIFDDMSPSLMGETFVKRPTKLLDTRGVYTVTIYPAIAGQTHIPGPVSIGVRWTPGCNTIVWCKGKKQRISTGPRRTLTNTKDAGLYTIRRTRRGQRGWFVQIRVIAASCPAGQHLNDPEDPTSCMTATVTCKNGGVLKDGENFCTCPPFFGDIDCGFAALTTCDAGWSFFGQYCYFVNNNAANWQDQEDTCQERGGHLASIHSEEEQLFVEGLILGTGTGVLFYFGLNDIVEEDTFVYTDGSEFDFTTWDDDEPNNGLDNPAEPQDCAVIVTDGVVNGDWRDTLCTRPFSAVCKKRAEPDFVLAGDGDKGVSCRDLPGGNPKCKGYLICYGDNYGCKCSSGWSGNACDRPCPKGKYGANCEQRCPESESDCSRFFGPSTNLDGSSCQ